MVFPWLSPSSGGHWWKSSGNMLASRRLLAAFNSTGAYASKTCRNAQKHNSSNSTRGTLRGTLRSTLLLFIVILPFWVVIHCYPSILMSSIASHVEIRCWWFPSLWTSLQCLTVPQTEARWKRKRRAMPCHASDSMTEAVQNTSKNSQNW